MEKEVIRVWFCNRRQKEKRINPCSAAPMLPSPGMRFGLELIYFLPNTKSFFLVIFLML